MWVYGIPARPVSSDRPDSTLLECVGVSIMTVGEIKKRIQDMPPEHKDTCLAVMIKRYRELTEKD